VSARREKPGAPPAGAHSSGTPSDTTIEPADSNAPTLPPESAPLRSPSASAAGAAGGTRGKQGAPQRKVSGRQGAVRAAGIERLQQLAVELPLEEGIETLVRAVCEATRDVSPSLHVGALVAGEGHEGHPLVIRVAPRGGQATDPPPPDAGQSSRLFPERAREHVVRLPAPYAGTSFHVAVGALDDAHAGAASGPGSRGRDSVPHDTLRFGPPSFDLDELRPDELAERGALLLASGLRGLSLLRSRHGDGAQLRELQARVVQSEKLASVGQIAAQVVHELNNPLTAIVAYADFLVKKLDRSGHEQGDLERLRRIGESADRILRFTRDLTTYARPNDELPMPVSMTDVLERAATFCEHILGRHGISLRFSFDRHTPTMVGRRGQLTQVFVNLITNAAHAIQDAGRVDGGEIEIGAGPLVDDNGAPVGLQVSVGDNGNGISPENVVRVFDPFFTTKAEGRGTGLGLSIVRTIVESHGGRVWVRSIVGTGTKFVLEFVSGGSLGG
jgi:signal transduction histidine kinase